MRNQRVGRLALAAGIACLWGMANAAAVAENPRKLKSNPDQEYYVYLPADFDAQRTYWLFVAVHGLGGNGKGALGWERFADEGQCIVVGPTFKNEDQFQFPSKGAGNQMKAILRELAKECKFHPKIFVTGFSAGAQFAHRFALENSALVVGCAAHSAGSWSNPTPAARMVPFLVTCGTDDKENDRIGGAKKFVQELEQRRFKVESKWFDKVGHSLCADARQMTRDLYWTVTTGMAPKQREEVAADLAKADALITDENYAEAAPLLKKVAALKTGGDFAERALAALRQIENAGKDKLAKADEQAKADPDAAITALEQIQEQFKGTRVAAAAQQRLAALKTAAKPEPPETKVEPSPKSSTPPGSREEQDCRRWFLMARNFIANGNKDKARQYLDKIVETYPESKHAENARKMIREL